MNLPEGMSIADLQKSILYSESLGIKLKELNENELFKWFLASILYGARIGESIAGKTYHTFEKYHLTTPEKILEKSWDYLVNPIMREGGYVRYDGRKSTQILKDCQHLLDFYDGALNEIHNQASNSQDLENRLTQFYGIGPVTATIFLRELRPFWEKSNPDPLPVVSLLMKELNISVKKEDRKSLKFTRLEAGLTRLRKSIKKQRV